MKLFQQTLLGERNELGLLFFFADRKKSQFQETLLAPNVWDLRDLGARLATALLFTALLSENWDPPKFQHRK
jgi:hypothetical protein